MCALGAVTAAGFAAAGVCDDFAECEKNDYAKKYKNQNIPEVHSTAPKPQA